MAVEEVTGYQITDGRCFVNKGEAYKEDRRVLADSVPVGRGRPLTGKKDFEKLVVEVRDWLAKALRSLEVERQEVDEAVSRNGRGEE